MYDGLLAFFVSFLTCNSKQQERGSIEVGREEVNVAKRERVRRGEKIANCHGEAEDSFCNGAYSPGSTRVLT
jgi:hypothetical protein